MAEAAAGALGSTRPRLLDAARFRTASSEDDGVVLFIEREVLAQPRSPSDA